MGNHREGFPSLPFPSLPFLGHLSPLILDIHPLTIHRFAVYFFYPPQRPGPYRMLRVKPRQPGRTPTATPIGTQPARCPTGHTGHS